MDSWYYSPYPEPYASQHKLYVCEFTLKYFRKKQTLLQHQAKLLVRHPPGGCVLKFKRWHASRVLAVGLQHLDKLLHRHLAGGWNFVKSLHAGRVFVCVWSGDAKELQIQFMPQNSMECFQDLSQRQVKVLLARFFNLSFLGLARIV
jgi:hypothetical protein